MGVHRDYFCVKTKNVFSMSLSATVVQECRDGSDERNCSRCLQCHSIYLSVYVVLFLTMLCLINSRSHRHSVGKV